MIQTARKRNCLRDKLVGRGGGVYYRLAGERDLPLFSPTEHIAKTFHPIACFVYK